MLSTRNAALSALATLLLAGCVPEGGDKSDPVTIVPPEPDAGIAACADGLDNDEDGVVDLDDPGCEDAEDRDETDEAEADAGEALPECSDGEDNDGDGQIDLADAGCGSAMDDDESDDPAGPQCADEEDNDQDGFVDFPADPGCGSEFDDDEGDDGGVILPQCGNGVDDDNDGQVDLSDPGCVSEADPREADPETPPACSNAVDDDNDGIIDFPLEPGCSAAGDEDETDPPQPPACGNGLDDDLDNATDYPEDPGCAGVGDRDETDPMIAPACSDGIDNDRDDETDYPEDRGCASAADGSEGGSCGQIYNPAEIAEGQLVRGDSRRGAYEAAGSCGGVGAPEVVFVYRVSRTIEALRITTANEGNALESTIYVRRGCLDDNTEVACAREEVDDGEIGNEVLVPSPSLGDYYIFLDGAAGFGGDYVLRVEEVPLAQCLNSVDDDEDGRIDFPSDPGCERPEDRDETDPEVAPLCSDGEDNDGDGVIDFPLDGGCSSAADQDEVDLCGQGLRISNYPVGDPFIITDTNLGGSNQFGGSCGGAGLNERVFAYANPHNARLRVSVDYPETVNNTIVYARSSCLDAGSELDCDQGEGVERRGSLTLDRVPPGDVYIVVDHSLGLGGQVKLSVEVERLPPGCSDLIDNDEDGFTDADDLGCATPEDEDERDPDMNLPRPACWDGEDNDEDGIVDYPFDPGCHGRGDEDETDPDEPPECSNGVDDDGDEVIDFPAERGCYAAGDPDEGFPPALRPKCSNSIDDDGDNLADYPNDPGCHAPGDLSEQDEEIQPACANREDDDRDGLVDFPFDPGCIAAGHLSEEDPEEGFACSNGVDDDEDGIIDFPLDPGCTFAADDDEEDPRFVPACSDGNDNDNNGRIDFPDDPGCRFAGDRLEETSGPVLARCADGVDNDLDGLTDLADVGCLNARDNDETDPEVPPACANGEDDDDDDTTDWPDDPGCAAQGDECEQGGFGLCDGVCQELLSNELHCGRCGRACSEGVQCIEGRCGELREIVQLCGRSGRPIQQFIVGDLVDAELILRDSCEPGDDVQAILITRNGHQQIAAQAPQIQDYVEGGGILITEFNNSDEIYNAIVGGNVMQGARNGSCQDNVQPVVQFNPQDPFWQDNEFQALPAASSGCGAAVGHFPGVTAIGGWNAANVSLAYIDVGNGRIWFVDLDWQDNGNQFTEQSAALMGYMISGGSAVANLPPCIDGRDNDEDGFIDFDDSGCEGIEDEVEGDPEVEPACNDGEDNDMDGTVDFPQELGCESRGDDDEADPEELPQCANGVDDDNDGEVDYPFDPGCVGAGDPQERDPVRRPKCGNNRDDDEDGVVDFPADPGCLAAGDWTEEDPAQVPRCANGIDDDRDGITDWPFDLGCQAAVDDDEADPEELPQCSNRVDDDEDELIDFPADPGCTFAADPRERDPVDAPVCANGVDDDADGQADYPDDRGCRFAGDDSEVDPFELPSRCEDGVDNDGDALVDLSDPGCENRDDDDEEDGEEPPICDNEIDDDEDGLLDWPADPGCQAQGDSGEDQSCREGLEVIDIEANGSVMGATAEEDEDNFRNQCGGRDAPEQVYRYVLEAEADLVVSAENEGTDYPVVLSVRRDCEEPRAMLDCAGDFRRPEPTIRLAGAEPGEYYIFVDGGGPERWVSSDGDIALPLDPNGFMARHDLANNCWSDGGNDAFDCYGRIQVTHAGQASGELRLAVNGVEGGTAQAAAGLYAFEYDVEFPHQNLLRVRLTPNVENDERPVNISITGNLGSDGGTVSAQRQIMFQGRALTYLHTSDNFAAPRDPPVLHMLIPSDPEHLGLVNYAINRDNPTITANNVTLPATFYITLHYGDHAAATAAVLRDIEIQAGGGGADAPRFGNFELSVSEE